MTEKTLLSHSVRRNGVKMCTFRRPNRKNIQNVEKIFVDGQVREHSP